MRLRFIKLLRSNKKFSTGASGRYERRFLSMAPQFDLPLMTQVVDLRSDTISLLTPEMRKAMFEAEVGDDVFGEDPTVKELEKKVAFMTEKEAAIFVPSGTMSNLIAVLAHCEKRRSEIIVGHKSHIVLFEQTGVAQFGGINIMTVNNNEDGTFDLDELDKKIRLDDIHEPITSLICVENTHNICGGKVLPLKWINQLAEYAARKDIPLHLDGARLWNAAVHLKMSVADLVRPFRTVSLCFSKSLCCPYGTVLAGPAKFINEARYIRKALGGGTRQIGLMAAPAIYALDHIFPKLNEDHVRTQKIAAAIRDMQCPDVTVPAAEDIHTNILMVTFHNENFNAEDFTTKISQVTEDELTDLKDSISVQIMVFSKTCARMVLYNNITDEQIKSAIKKVQYVIKGHQEKSVQQDFENSAAKRTASY